MGCIGVVDAKLHCNKNARSVSNAWSKAVENSVFSPKCWSP